MHIGVPSPHRAPRGKSVRGHKLAVSERELLSVNGLPITRPERTWFDLGSELQLDDLVAAGDHLIQRSRPFTSVARLEDVVLAHSGERGTAALKEALLLLDDGAESRKETQLRLILVRGGLTDFVSNLPIVVPGVRIVYRGDLVDPVRKIIVEYQGGHHRDPA